MESLNDLLEYAKGDKTKACSHIREIPDFNIRKNVSYHPVKGLNNRGRLSVNKHTNKFYTPKFNDIFNSLSNLIIRINNDGYIKLREDWEEKNSTAFKDKCYYDYLCNIIELLEEGTGDLIFNFISDVEFDKVICLNDLSENDLSEIHLVRKLLICVRTFEIDDFCYLAREFLGAGMSFNMREKLKDIRII